MNTLKDRENKRYDIRWGATILNIELKIDEI